MGLYKNESLEVDFNELLKKNPDTVGWIEVKGTNINYPIVQTTDNSYYLTHAFDKTKNEAGWVFMDYRNDAVNFNQNTILYAHSRLTGSMFGSLKNILESSWYTNKNNHIIRLSLQLKIQCGKYLVFILFLKKVIILRLILIAMKPIKNF